MYVSARIYKGIFFILTAVFIFSALPASAQVTFTDNRAEFLAANPDLLFQDFLGTPVGPGEFLDCDPPVNSRSDDECFRPGQIFTGIEFTNSPAPDHGDLFIAGADVVGNNNPENVLANDIFDDSFDILFTVPQVKTVGLTIGCLSEGVPCSEGVRVLVSGAGGLLGETVVPASSAFDSFLGIASSEGITKISLRHVNPDTDTVQGVLNVWYNIETLNVPTLSEWGMIAAAAGLMLVGMFFVLKRKRSRMENADSRFLGNDRKS